jgi:hypothetical protein
MKAKIAIFVFISLFLFSCVPATPTQEDEVVEIVTEEIVTEESESQPAITEEPIVTEEPTETPTETPIACVTLLTPINGVEIPPVGKVTFSWTPMDEAEKYVLNIILPSGEVVAFQTNQTFHDRYMEAFISGGEYQWQVVAQGKDGSEICISDVAKFDKSAYQPPKNNGGGGNDDGGDGGGTCPDGSPKDPIFGCGGS